MYSSSERAALREALIDAARKDERVSGAAITGSVAIGAEDAWSDIDLAFAVPGDLRAVITDFTARMYDDHHAVHHMDVTVGATVFRVFLLADTLQVDLAFWPAHEFGATSPKFDLVFGDAQVKDHVAPPRPDQLIDEAWLHALHVRSSIARGRVWQAEYMLSTVRDQVLALACLRHGVAAVQGRGIDQLPAELTIRLVGALVRTLDIDELRRAFRVVTDALIDEIRLVDPTVAERLTAPLLALTGA